MSKQYKNPVFNRNIIDPTNNKVVKSIWWHHNSKLDRNIRSMVWEHYRYRGRKSVAEIYNEYRQRKIEIIYSGEPQPVFIDMSKQPLPEDLLIKIKTHLDFVKTEEEKERLLKKITKQEKILSSLQSNKDKLAKILNKSSASASSYSSEEEYQEEKLEEKQEEKE